MLLLSLAVVTAGCAATDPDAGGAATEGFEEVADLHVVDCLLPGQVRRLGNQTYVTPRRPIETTAADCKVRGGEYTAYDRADYKSALKVWMPAAERGDPKAQTNVGEIFEKGLGTDPNYEAAAIWYRKAAEQGYERAQFNLGTLYEQGLGVEQDSVTALNWYRQAWGIEEDNVMFESAAKRERAKLEERLRTAVEEKEQQIEVLRDRLAELQAKLEATSERSASAEAEVESLNSLIAQLEEQQRESEEELNAIAAASPDEAAAPAVAAADGPRTREPMPADPVEHQAVAEERWFRDVSLGSYYALLIGNENYSSLEDLETPLSDLQRAKRVLEDKYGFTVFTIANGNNIEVMRAINDLDEVVGPEDNLLIFYAGHGNRLNTGGQEIGYWLPSNAERPPRNTYWVANEFVTGHLSRLDAKRVLVVADSCYAGLLSGEPSFLLSGDAGPSYDDMEFLRFKLDKRSRLLLSSGGDRPVLDQGGGEHSVFADAFLDELENNDDLLAGPELFMNVRERVEQEAADLAFEQTPEFKTIKAAGHEVGDFFFVPEDLR
ncbi:MAG: caspase family protein [Pseudomonadota bacterium]